MKESLHGRRSDNVIVLEEVMFGKEVVGPAENQELAVREGAMKALRKDMVGMMCCGMSIRGG